MCIFPSEQSIRLKLFLESEQLKKKQESSDIRAYMMPVSSVL